MAVGTAAEHALVAESQHVGVENIRRFFYPAGLVTTHQRLARGMNAEVRKALRIANESFDAVDALGLVVQPKPGVVAVLFHIANQLIELAPQQKRLLTQVALHIEVAWRLRLNPDTVHGEILPDGRIWRQDRWTQRVSRRGCARSSVFVHGVTGTNSTPLTCGRRSWTGASVSSNAPRAGAAATGLSRTRRNVCRCGPRRPARSR